MFANMLMFYLLFGATRFLSIKIESQKRRESNPSRPHTTTAPRPKSKEARQAPLRLARLDNRKARPGGAAIPRQMIICSLPSL